VLIIKPREVTDGGIVLTRETVDTEAMLASVGILVSMGTAAFKSKTRAEIDFGDEPFNPRLGEYVLFPTHCGMPIKVRNGKDPANDITFKIMADSDLLGITRTPEAFRYYV
jgi:hypothetical protein